MSASEPSVLRRALGPGLLLVLATVVVSGVSNFVNFRAVQGTDVDAWITARNGLVALLLVPMAILASSSARPRLTRSDWARLLLIGLLGGAVPFLLYFHGFQMASAAGGAATASFGYRSLFLMASVLALVFLGERLPRRYAVGAGALLLGNALLLALSGPLWTDGTGFVLLATAMWAAEYTISKYALRSLPSGTVALGRMGFGTLFLVIYVGLTGHASSFVGFSSADWMTVALSALLLFVFVTTWYAGLKTVDLSVASALLVLAFPITWALGVVASTSALSAGPLAGAVLVVLGAGLVLGLRGMRSAWARIPHWLRTRLDGVG